MIKLQDKKFKTLQEELEKLTPGERVGFFAGGTPSHFLAWYFYYFPEDFNSLLADFHYGWIESIHGDINTMIEGFRGSAKTSLTIASIIYFICIKKYSFIVWQSYESKASTRNTTQIALKLMNKKLENDYGVLFATSGKRDELEKRSVSDFDTTNGIKILSASLGEKLRGALHKNTRIDLLILDDIDITDSVRNPEIIQKNYEKITGETFGALSKEKSKIIFLGNTINQDGIVPRFRKEKKGTKTWQVFHQPLIVDGEIQWDFFTKEMIDKIKENEGPIAFNQNYLLIPIDLYEDGLIKIEDLRYYHTLNLEDFDILYMHCDTTHTGKQTSDYFAPMIIGENKRDKNYYVIDFMLEKIDVEKQARAVINMYIKYSDKIKKLTYDEKSNNGFGFWIKKLAKEEYNISLPIEELRYPNDKVSHFTPHIPHFKANRVYLPSNHKDLKEAETQILAFPVKGVNDDIIDALSGCLDNYAKIKSKIETKPKQYINKLTGQVIKI